MRHVRHYTLEGGSGGHGLPWVMERLAALRAPARG